MKRLWFSAVFLAIALSICIAEQYIVKSSCGEIIKSIDSAISATDENEKEKYCNDAIKGWEDYYKKASYITDHSVIQGADISMGELEEVIKTDIDRADEKLVEAKSEIEQIKEVSKVNLANIF